MALLYCQICRKQYPDTFLWYICDTCGFRVCPICMSSGRQQGPYGSGSKCGQCFQGRLKRL